MAMSPSQRNAEDIKRLKARAARRGLTPGPGSYSPERQSSSSTDLSGHFAFRSSTQRIKVNFLNDTGDPGEYDAQLYLSLVKQASTSWNKSATEGRSAFGANQARKLDMKASLAAWNEGEKTPGPAAYQVQTDEKGREWQLSAMADGERMQSAVFASKVERTSSATLLPSINNPGPGAYDPDDRITIEHLPGANPDNNPMSKMGRDKRYTGDTMVNNRGAGGPEVGPGSYESHLLGSLEKEMKDNASQSSQLQINSKPGSGALGFGARATQHELPHEMIPEIKSATPGPGAYDIRGTRFGAELDPTTGTRTSSFMPGNIATEIKTDNKGDPGAYNPTEHRELAWEAKRTFHEQSKVGKSAFGATTARELRIPATCGADLRGLIPDVTPGPAAYKPSLSHRIYVKSVTAFKSVVPQRTKFNSSSNDNPGPGAYDPDDRITIEHLPGANPDNNPMSKLGRDKRYTGDSMVNNSGAGGPEVGPGSYEAHLPGTIAQQSQQAVDRSEQHIKGSATASEPRGARLSREPLARQNCGTHPS